MRACQSLPARPLPGVFPTISEARSSTSRAAVISGRPKACMWGSPGEEPELGPMRRCHSACTLLPVFGVWQGGFRDADAARPEALFEVHIAQAPDEHHPSDASQIGVPPPGAEQGTRQWTARPGTPSA